MSKFLYILKVLRTRGLGFFWIYFRQALWFDMRHGTDTNQRVTKDNQSVEVRSGDFNDGLLYVASLTIVVTDTLGHAETILGEAGFDNAQFIDLGCGKGKTLFVYVQRFGSRARHPAVGIEYDADLTRIAHNNIAKLEYGRDQLNVVCDTAVNLHAHTVEGPLIVYIYNSFRGETLRSVLAELMTVPHVLIYVDPVEKDILPRLGYRIHQDHQGCYNADTWLVATRNL